jgi:hypothetical protein
MKVTFEISNQDDADEAAGLLLALSDAFKLISGEREAPAPQKREKLSRPPSNGHSVEPEAGNGHVGRSQDDPEVARDRLRAIALRNGVLWIRPLLEECGAKRLGDLSDPQVRDLLRRFAG